MESRLYISGEWLATDETIDIVDPATQDVVARASKADAKLVAQAVTAAYEALGAWSQTPARKRAQVLNQINELLLKRKNEIAEVLSKEQGKPLVEAVGEVIYSADFFAWYAEEGKRIYGELIPPSRPGHELRVEHVPVGVVAAITPWNFPAGMLARKLAPALAAGCTVVLKPASQTPLTAIKFFEIFNEAGLPAGVANLVIGSGSEIGEQLLKDKRVRKVTFTGSTPVGASIMRQAAAKISKVSLELGGHAPFIVLDDADVDASIRNLLLIKMRNAGQTCISPNRIFVQSSIYEQFRQKLVEKVGQLKLGRYDTQKVNVGPLIDHSALTHMQSQVDDAVAKGALLLCGGKKCDDSHLVQGNFYLPTVLSDVTPDMNIFHEETFGPIIPLIRFESDSELIEQANDSIYGLAAYVFSQNYKRAKGIVDSLEYGTIAVNDISASDMAQAPTGGMKESGMGREGGRQGLYEFLECKYTLVNYK
ncbi:NAD-dependent succinate-semialdehyde dehydrogenase [Paenibacillus xerothermodurans]|uniref:NAD-dependent succinate-semialdehyde dehydrogenase n=1 Tax=Paenibacillus xerothermodurans TaxID=1977292 RepID=A0A2W1NA52_PAEXE|nr:NAD-dependent succinate-semialdehyde dehydrogenase [Paenibacillus xerothermodurans]